MKKHLKQSTICNVMAFTSCTIALLIFLSGMFTFIIFTKVTNLNSAREELSNNLRQLITVVNYQKDMARSYTQGGNSLYLDMYNTEANETHQMDSIITTMTSLTADPRGQDQLDSIIQNITGMTAIEQNIISLVQSSNLEEAQGIAFGKDYGIMMDSLNQAVDEFEQGMSNGIGRIITNLSTTTMVFGILIEFLCIILIIIQVINAFVTKKFIIRPLIKLKDSMIEMCQGHLSNKIDIEANDTEIGLLAGAMTDMKSKISSYIKEIDYVLNGISKKDISVKVTNQYEGDFESIHVSLNLIITSLSETFSSLSSSIDQVSDNSEHVSDTAQVLAQGVAEQAASVNQLSSSIEYISEQIKSNAEKATNANGLAVTAGSSLNSSNKQMAMLMSAMSEISVSSDEISNIIRTIEDIAFQTNILSLNAAVEAARAGDAGKGFAVVAEEVRNLASKSSEAAKQTNLLIEKSARSVQNGVKIANETASSLSDVVTDSVAMADLITKITLACEEQFSSISQINMGVEQISSVVQTNSITSEQSAEASEELSMQARTMKSLVNQYKL